MKILSLFDGISCGIIALERAGIPVKKYYASEVDKYAIKVSEANYPEIEQIGDITKVDFTQFQDIDMIIGGSPCQDLSAYKYDRGDVKGLEGSKSSLFYYYLEAIKTIKPKYFLLENVPMEPQWKDIITEELGVEPILINSNLVCAADRKRLYWTNIPNVTQPQDKGIILQDIVLPFNKVPLKYWYLKPFIYNGRHRKVECTLLQMKGQRNMKEVYNLRGKCNTLLCDGDGGNRMKKVFQWGRCRKLMPIEYERLQTLPDRYTEILSDSKRYSTIGNGWTVDVIAHIFKGLVD